MHLSRSSARRKASGMTDNDIALIRSSFAKAVPIADQVAETFYGRLFEIAPETRKLFNTDMEAQGRKLMLTLATVVHELHQLDTIMPTIKGLAIRHVSYGVQDSHYSHVGGALLHALDKHLGAGFTPETREAWSTAYGALSGIMIEAAHQGRPH